MTTRTTAAGRGGRADARREEHGTDRAEGRAHPRPEAAAELAERIAAVVAEHPDVAGLTAGPRVRVVTYRVGSPFAGVAVRPDEIEVGVVARPGRPFAEIAEDVRRVVAPLAGDRPVNVLIGDVADEGDG